MADPDRKRRVEHAHETQHLTYGHFGTATYEPRNARGWWFLRSDEISSGLREGSVSSTRTSLFRLLFQRVLRPSDGHLQTSSSERMSRRHPDLAFVSPVLIDDSDPPKADSSQQVLHLTGQRLSYGNASRLNARGQALSSGGIPVIVLPSGPAQEILWVSSIEADLVSFDNGSGIDPSVNIPISVSSGLQHESQTLGPILQLSFSRHCNLLGVRRASSTKLLRLLGLRSQVNTLAQASESSTQSSSSIRIDEIMTIPFSRTGGHPHAHLSFNPKDENNLALIDTHGVWSIWKLSRRNSLSARVLSAAYLKSSGRLLPPETLTGQLNSTEDGWHRICWLQSANSSVEVLLVCSRQYAAVYDAPGKLIGVIDMRIGVRAAKHLILDVQPCTNQPDICFVLTSTRIMVMRLAAKVLDTENNREPLDLICSWNHFRGLQDLTLRMSMLELSENEGTNSTRRLVHVVLFSGRNKDLTLYTLTMETLGNTLLASVRDASRFPVPDLALKQGSSISDLAFRVAGRDDETETGGYSGHGIFVTLLARTHDGAITEVVYEYRDPYGLEDLGHGVDAPIYSSRHVRNVASSRYVDDDDDMADFVVEDSSEGGRQHISKPKLDGNVVQTVQIMLSRARNWVDILSGGPDDAAGLDMTDQLQVLRSLLTDESSHSGKTLAEVIHSTGIDDIEEASEALSSWNDELSRGDSISNAASFSLLRITANTRRSLLEEYSALIDKYVKVLPVDIPDRVRVNTERLSRKIALETFLASYCSQRKPIDEVRSCGNLQSDDISGLSRKVPVDPLPLKEASAQSHTSGSPLSRLSNYMTVSPSASRTFNKEVVNEVIGHLPTDIAIEPSKYSYKDTELELAKVNNRVDTDIESGARKSARRSNRKDRKRLDRYTKTQDEIALEPAMIPNVVMSSQPPQAESSQSGGGQIISATQPERGAYGARPRTKPAKKRVAGF